MGRDAYLNLKKIASGTFGNFENEPFMGLETELLSPTENLGYISRKVEKVRSIHEIPREGPELCNFVEVTDAGKKFIDLREKRTPA